MRTYLRLLKFVKPYRLSFALALVCMIVFALTNGAMAYLLGPVMKFLFTTGSTGAPIEIIPGNIVTIPSDKMIVVVPFLIIGVAVFKGLSQFGNIFLMGYVGVRVMTDLRRDLYDHLLTLPINHFSNSPTGDILSRITVDVGQLQTTTADAIATVIRQVLTIIVLGGVVLYLDWQLAVAAFVVFPLAFYPMIKLGRKMKRESMGQQITIGALTALINEAIQGIRIVKAFCMEGYEFKRFIDENERYTRFMMKTVKIKALASPLMQSLGAVGFALTIWYAASRINAGTITPEECISFFAAVLMLYQPIKALSGIHLIIQQGLASAKRVFDLMDLEGEYGYDKGDKRLEGVGSEITFEGIEFSYGEKKILKGIDLTVKRGEMIAIVGSSGAGKTTFVNLIPRFYDINKGRILIDGTDIRNFTLKDLRSNIAIVSQQVVLFNDTVKRNVSYGDFNKRESEVERALEAANAKSFIDRLPEGVNTYIGEGGVRLSGGERQRLSIARAMLKDAPILIMDEATSSLDTESERAVQDGLNNLLKGRTSFVIAHRLSTVRNADRIIVLSSGEIKEEGTHDELIGIGGEYARLYSMQFRDEGGGDAPGAGDEIGGSNL